MNCIVIDRIVAPLSLDPAEGQKIVQRLYELGLHPGVEFKIIRRISFGTVTIIEYGHTRLALNEQEMACLHGRS